MEGNRAPAGLQKSAQDFLHGALRPHRNIDDIASEVIKLILEDEQNPLTDLIKARYCAAPEPGSPPSPVSRSRSSKLSLRLFGNRDKAPQQTKAVPGASKAAKSTLSRTERCQQEFQSVFQADVTFASDKKDGTATQSTGDNQGNTPLDSALTGTPGLAESGPKTYNCVFCGTDYSLKGTCKRHLEDIHVSKKYFECQKCNHPSATVPEARKHSTRCSAQLFGWNSIKPANKRYYGSEFSSDVFRNQQQYIEHLLELCVLPKHERPVRSLHLKLRNLLVHQKLEEALRTLSCREFGHPEAWKGVRWEHERIRRAVCELENGTLEHDSAPHELSMLNKSRVFLDELFADRLSLEEVSEGARVIAGHPAQDYASRTGEHGSGYTHLQSVAHNGAVEASGPQMMSVANDTNLVAHQYFNSPATAGQTPATESSGKRPLSYETAMTVPQRQPPGPPLSQQQTPGPDPESQGWSLPMRDDVDAISYGMSVPMWSPPEQPPPYDVTSMPTFNNIGQLNNQPQSAYPLHIDTLPTSMPYDGAFNDFVPQGGDVLSFYPQSAPHYGNGVVGSNVTGSGDINGYQSTGLATVDNSQARSYPWFNASEAGADDPTLGDERFG